ncbi:MAG: bifunctional heptose 7-phosphate kinase/heptose 1-phosphate adenyltransferase [Geodermatophilaceae bacterium]|nr:bifunctional heptose 7-phosphate kinase/heptose 1-phosphate adenyltransferase [Geodermatophilaceae bacterium]MDQ3465374.1 PfkB family carbohydrate kinase [Actinomycetota bacterium]
MTGPLVVVGDALLDVDLVGRSERLCPDAPVPVVDDVVEQARPGGAALAAALAAADGRDVVLIAPIASDADGERLRSLLENRLRLIGVPIDGETAVKRRVRVNGQSLVRLDSGRVGSVIGALPAEAVAALRNAAAVLVSDYGRGCTGRPDLRASLGHATPVVWDPHPRGAIPVTGVRLVTPNAAEAAQTTGRTGASLADIGRQADELVRTYEAGAVAVTLGSRGALLSYGGGAPLVVPAAYVASGDSCGAGDRFAATVAGLLADGALLTEAVAGAVWAATEFVAAGGAAGWATAEFVAAGGAAAVFVPVGGPTRGAAGDPPAATSMDATAEQVFARVRASGGTTVATGGCFDLLHAGHIATLRHARRLGDCLVVCLNSDDSVRRLKGTDRPLVPAVDRARVVAALGCVDAVVIFDEDTPEAVLCRLRPDVWVKGGDYAGADLPEAPLLRSWNGQAVAVPYLEGRSTTGLIRALSQPREDNHL